MLTYYYTRLAQMICEEQLEKRREPINLGHPGKSRHFRPAGEGNPGSMTGVPRVIRSAARAVAAFLL
ncbi:MAG: hypothetical protein MUF84_17355 [Anaerolineae bacterium]|jgi:hypothetical protein|nr:hypothetical protein [Anaerolineae bacterium]